MNLEATLRDWSHPTLLISGMNPMALEGGGDRFGGDEVVLMEGLVRRLNGYVDHVRSMRRLFGDRGQALQEYALRVVHRPVLEPDGEGVLIDGACPTYWIHLGHGPGEDATLYDECMLSLGDDEHGPWWDVDEVVRHLRSGSGRVLWVGLPLCRGSLVAQRLREARVVHQAVGPDVAIPDAWAGFSVLAEDVEKMAKDLLMLSRREAPTP